MAGLRRMVGSLLDAVDPDDRVRKLRARLAEQRDPRHRFLKSVRGVVHVGANTGQERDLYRAANLSVLWVEPIPEVFEALSRNLQGYPRQTAVQALVTAKDGEVHTLHVANNGGASSSILNFQDHAEIWPDIAFCDDIELTSTTLDSLMAGRGEAYDALVLDTQGSELMALQGGVETLKSMRYVVVEAADFEAYAGCAQVADIERFMTSQGFSLARKDLIAARPTGDGSYFDLLFQRASAA